jgi:cell wall-associated NlpC family hydrolase
MIAAGIGLLPPVFAAGSLMAEVVLVQPAGLAAPRREWIGKALAFLKEHPVVPYVEGGADVAGMDCSGAVVRLLKLVEIEPPRSARGQYEWLRKTGRLTIVPTAARTADDPVFHTLQPGDLIFWASDGPAAPAGPRVSHVHMFLGEEKDGHAVMIGSSDGRSYRGKKISGFGIVDYRMPRAGSPTRIVAFGSPFPAAVKPAPDQAEPPASGSPQPNP